MILEATVGSWDGGYGCRMRIKAKVNPRLEMQIETGKQEVGPSKVEISRKVGWSGENYGGLGRAGSVWLAGLMITRNKVVIRFSDVLISTSVYRECGSDQRGTAQNDCWR